MKVGDKVRLQGIPAYLKGVQDGDEGVVHLISDDPIQPYHIMLENGQVRTFARKELRLPREVDVTSDL